MNDEVDPAREPRREDFVNPNRNPFGNEVATRPVGSIANAEQQKSIAEVQARMIIARANPRDPIRCMDMILRDCTRPTLAEKGLYQYARGGSSISGPSIRLAEAIAQRWGNIASGIKEISRSNGYSECVAYAWDLESGYYDERQYQVRHWRDTKGGGYAITDERDIYELIANMGQRRKRAVLLTVIPGDVVEAAQEECERTLHVTADTSPDALLKVLNAFEQFGVTKAQLEKRCQCRFEAVRPAQIVQLRKIYASLKDGMSDPGDWFETNGVWDATEKAHEANKPAPRKQQSSQTGAAAPSGAEGGPVQDHGQTVLGQTAGENPATVERDSAGVIWNEKLHASSKAKNSDGTWRARRGADRTQAQQQADDGPPPGLFPEDGGQVTETNMERAKQAFPVDDAKQEATAFNQWLVDGEGEAIPDADGVIGAYDDPVAWARAYKNAEDTMFPGDLELFRKANAEARAQAMIASTEVAPILAGKSADDAPKATMGQGATVDPLFIPPPAKNTREELESYNARLAVLARASLGDYDLNLIETKNSDAIEALPPKYRLAAKGLIDARRKELAPAPKRDETTDFMKLADSLLADIESFDAPNDFVAWRGYEKVRQELESLRIGSPDLYSKVMDAAAKREGEVNKPTERTPRQIADGMLAALESCKTREEVVAWGKRVDVIEDAKILQANAPEMWAEVAKVGGTRHKPA